MSLFKRKQEPAPEPDRAQTTGQPRFVFNETKPDGTVYETYRAADTEAAKAFLMTKRVEQGLYYIVVETPQGNWGTDIDGLYLENLLPWQLDTSAADCTGRITAVTSVASVATAARGILDNFVARVQCGRCGHLWHDGLRYRDSTLVRCPNCKARNGVDSSGVIVSILPGQRTVLTTSHDITVEKSEDDQAVPDPEMAMAGADQALAAARDAVAATPRGHPHRPGRLFQLGCGLEERFKRTGELADLDAAISAFSEAADSALSQDAGLPSHLAAVNRTLNARFERTGELTDLDAVISALRAALAALPPTAPERPGLLSALGLALRDRFERTSRLADLDDAVAAGRDSVAADPAGNPSHLINLSATLRGRFEHAGRREDLDEAITVGRAAATATGPGHPDYFACRGTLGLALQERFTATGNLADLDEAVTLFAEAVAVTSPDHPHYPGHLHNLGRALLARYQCTGQLADLDGSVAAASRAATAVAPDEPNRARHVSQFGHALIVRFERTGDLGDLDEGITILRQGAADTPPGHSDHALHLSIIGDALLARFSRVGRLSDLTEAIDAIRDAADATPDTHPDRPRYLDSLGIALQHRCDRTGHLADLDAAIDAGRQAVAGVSPGHVRYPGYLSNLGCALRSRFDHGGRLADLDEAVTAFRDAIAATASGHFDLHGLRTNLGSALIDRFKRAGEMADLDEAIAADRLAVAGTPSDHPWYLTQVHNLSHALRTRYEHTGAVGDLDEALATARTAMAATPPDHPRRAAHLNNLGIIRYRQFEHTDEMADLDQAIVAFREAADTESAPSSERIHAARLWGHAAVGAHRLDSAADGLAAAVRLLPQFAWHGSSRAIREERVAEMSGLASDAAACAIRAGRPEQAAEVLEAGRSVLWTQMLNLRTDLTDLAEREPYLASRLDQIRTVLDASQAAPPMTPDPVSGADPAERLRAEQNRVAAERMRLAGEFDDLVRQIRSTVDGFEHFLRPVPFAQLRSAADGGTVAIVNTGSYGCHALLVSGAGMRVVELSSLTREKAVAQANTLLGIVTRADSNLSFLDRKPDRQTVLDILAWLWDAVAEPILTELGYTSPPAPGSAPPRIWWCPTGGLALLPLHAAGHYPRHQPGDPPGTDTVPDRVISSYTPTLSALLRARGAPAPAGKPALLAIGMPTTPGAGDLPAVPHELDRLHARYPIATRLQSPVPGADGPALDPGNQPTTARVLEELPRHAWVHFSCHGSQHFSDPAESAFWLTDGPLRVADLIQQDAGSRELAFLSACQTSTGSPKAADEAIHLASAMQLLGYRNVIATLWSIYDSLTPDVADGVYAALAAGGAPDSARALHQAVAALRARRPTDPLAWAPYLHLGP